MPLSEFRTPHTRFTRKLHTRKGATTVTKRNHPRLTHVFLIAGLLVMAACSATWALGPMDSPWPMFRHDSRHSATSPYGDPTPTGPAWSYSAGGGLSSPVIASDGTIYIGGNGYLVAMNGDGTFKWKLSIGGGGTRSTPAIADDGTVYIGTTAGRVYAVNPNGTQKWYYSTGGSEISCSPTIGPDGVIYIGSRNASFFAINPDGTLKWSRPTGGGHMGAACIGPDGTIYVGGGFNLYAVNPVDGSTKWMYVTGYTIQSAPAMSPDGSRVYVGSCDAYLHAVNAETGAMIWQTTVPLVPASTSSSPAVSPSGMIYIGSNGASASMGGGALFAINSSGEIVWQYQTAYDVRSSPSVSADGTVYIGVMDGFVFAFNPDGTKKWQYLTTASGSGIYGSPAIAADGSIIVQNIGGTVFGNLTCTPPAANAPSDLVVTATSDSATSLTWVDNSDNEFGFRIQRRMGTKGDFVTVKSVGAGITTTTNTGLASGQTYYYRVCAYQQAGDSQFSPATGILMPGLPAPTDLIAEPITGTQVDLSWTDLATEELGFKIERFQGVAGPFVQVARVGADVSSYSDMSVNPGINYYYRVRAYDATRDSSYSNEDWAVTPGFDYGNIIRGNTERPQIALTYDAGTAGIRGALLDTLKQKQVYCNFYITGYVAQTQPALLKRITDEGHLMGNHSIDHPAFTQITDQEMDRQLNTTDNIIYGLTGHKTRQWWRGPYGSVNDHVIDVTSTLGFRHAAWSIDSGDVGGRSSSAITDTFVDGAANGNVCLSHCTLANSEGAAAGTIDGLRALGYELVTVAELVAPLQVTAPASDVAPGWNFLSFPIDPANTTPMCTFRGVDIDAKLFRCNKETGVQSAFSQTTPEPFGQLSSDEGYWLYLTPGQNVKFNGYEATNDRHIKLPQACTTPDGAMTMIGYPFQDPQPVANLMVYNPNAPEPKLRSLEQARNAGWVSSMLYGYDAVYQSMFMTGLEDDYVEFTLLQPWHGYWFTSYVNELELIIPTPVQPT